MYLRCCRSNQKSCGELGGPPCTYVGHPLIERLGDLRPNELEKRLRMAGPPLLLVMPGSRSGELKRMAPVFGAAVARVAEQFGDVEAVVPAVPRLADTVRAAVASWRVPTRVVIDASEKNEAFRTARAALTKSGTSTLELALAGVPMVAAYKVSLIEEPAARLLINVPSVILANLTLGRKYRAGVPSAGLHRRTACGGRCCRCWPTRQSDDGKSRPLPPLMQLWKSGPRSQATGPPRWCSIVL